MEIATNGLGIGPALGALLNLPWVLLIDGAIVTFIFAVIEQADVRCGAKFYFVTTGPAWARDMPSLFEPGPDEKNKRRSCAGAMAEVILGFIFFAWLLLIPHYSILWLGPGASHLAMLPYILAPVWWPFYWSLVALNGFELAWKTVAFARGAWQGPHRARHMAMRLFSLVPTGVLLFAPDPVLFLLKNPAVDAAARGAQLTAAKKGIHIGLAILFAILLLKVAWSAGNMAMDGWRKRRAAL